MLLLAITLVLLLIVGYIAFLIIRSFPIDANIKMALNLLVVLILVYFLLRELGVLHAL